MIRVCAPGKLFLAGEWAILQQGNPGIVAAIDKKVWAEVQGLAGKAVSVTVEEFGIRDVRFTWNGKELAIFPLHQVDPEKITFLRRAVETALRFLEAKGRAFQPFKIRTWGEETAVEIDGKHTKVGFGSSAASVVAVVDAVLRFHGYPAAKEEVFKLAAIAHYFAQGKIGSGFDVAASTYGGVFVYERFPEQWVIGQLQAGMSLPDLVAAPWPGLRVEPLALPPGLRLLVGFTGSSASTTSLVRQVQEWGNAHAQELAALNGRIGKLVADLIPHWQRGDQQAILSAVHQNEDVLRELGDRAGVPIETPLLRQLSDLAFREGGAGKLSGAGGGDCGIALCFSAEAEEGIARAWEQAGLRRIPAGIDLHGVRVA